ncbi:hypothetical protein TNCV_1397291 [Trichonephila clavipes]|nr:hypothetical protein TNCV_1397291 [Trichonephila clavipes]
MTLQLPSGNWQHVGLLLQATFFHLLHRELRAKIPLYRIPLKTNHRRQRLQWAHEHREHGRHISNKLSFLTNTTIICGTMTGAFVLKCSAGEHCLPECIIECHSD